MVGKRLGYPNYSTVVGVLSIALVRILLRCPAWIFCYAEGEGTSGQGSEIWNVVVDTLGVFVEGLPRSPPLKSNKLLSITFMSN